jgi:hypothetical protein
MGSESLRGSARRERVGGSDGDVKVARVRATARDALMV